MVLQLQVLYNFRDSNLCNFGIKSDLEKEHGFLMNELASKDSYGR
jgi:hypothetical protein